jgi:hypothetical protein
MVWVSGKVSSGRILVLLTCQDGVRNTDEEKDISILKEEAMEIDGDRYRRGVEARG